MKLTENSNFNSLESYTEVDQYLQLHRNSHELRLLYILNLINDYQKEKSLITLNKAKNQLETIFNLIENIDMSLAVNTEAKIWAINDLISSIDRQSSKQKQVVKRLPENLIAKEAEKISNILRCAI